MLHVSGRTPRMGTTHDGKSYLDYDDEEIRRKFTISTSVAPIPYKDYKINLLDTSGHPDFIGDTLATMQAAEMALFVIDAVAGPQVMTTKLWREAEGMRLSRAVFINHIDREHADFEIIHGHAPRPLRLAAWDRSPSPSAWRRTSSGVIDIIRMKARYFDKDGTSERIEDIPPEYLDAAQTARDKLCDLVAEADDDLMMKYLDGEEPLTQQELETLLDKAIAQELFIPVFVGSTIIKQGIQGAHGGHRHLLPASAPSRTVPPGQRRDHLRGRDRRARRLRVQDRGRPLRGALELRQGHLRRAGPRAWSLSTRAPARRSAWATST